MTHELHCHDIKDPYIAEIFEADAAKCGGCKAIWDLGLHDDEQEAKEWESWDMLAAMRRDW